MDVYDLVAKHKGVESDELPPRERQDLAARALQVIWPGMEHWPLYDWATRLNIVP